MPTAEEVLQRIQGAMPEAEVSLVTNTSPCAQHGVLVSVAHACAVARFLRDAPELRLDFLSNVTGIDHPAAEPGGGHLEAVYHLYSVALRHGPVTLRMRTRDRADGARLPSLTPVWRSAEFQEREIYDLFGIVFEGHPDLRRLLMWDEFTDHPMRRDYVPPDDYEYEPTPHDEVLVRARAHDPAARPVAPAEGTPP
jgi:NADH-quinone oxidoreductase subunit C